MCATHTRYNDLGVVTPTAEGDKIPIGVTAAAVVVLWHQEGARGGGQDGDVGGGIENRMESKKGTLKLRIFCLILLFSCTAGG